MIAEITSTPKSILVVKNRALGDCLMGLSTLAYLRSVFPHTQIIYAVPSWIEPVFSQAKTPADKIISFNLKNLFKLRPQYILELHQSARSARVLKIWHFLTFTPYFFHNHHVKEKTKVLDQGLNKPAIQRDLDGCFSALKAWGFIQTNQPPSFLDFPPQLIVNNLKKDAQKIILGVSATRDTKMWPLSYYPDLCKKILATNPQTQFLIPLSTSLRDQKIEEDLQKLIWPNSVQVVKEDLAKLPAFLASAHLYIGNDSGLKHLCACLGMKTVTFFGPENPAEWHPYSLEKHAYFFAEPLTCRTQISHYCPLNTCDSMICLNQFTPEQVTPKILEILHR